MPTPADPSAAAPLAGRVAVVTGVSRRRGIGFALVRRLLDDGASVLATGWTPHDQTMPWGADPGGTDPLVAELEGGSRLRYIATDLADPDAPDAVVRAAVDAFGGVDIVVANHAHSSSKSLLELTSYELDQSWAVNVRASLLLAKSLAERRDDDRRGGRVVLFTSGQHRGPMPDELPYAVTKGAVHQMTSSLSAALMPLRVTVNCINPGPVDTGWADDATYAAVAEHFPSGRWSEPEHTARVVSWLVSDEAEWITGQVIDAEAGFTR